MNVIPFSLKNLQDGQGHIIDSELDKLSISRNCDEGFEKSALDRHLLEDFKVEVAIGFPQYVIGLNGELIYPLTDSNFVCPTQTSAFEFRLDNSHPLYILLINLAILISVLAFSILLFAIWLRFGDICHMHVLFNITLHLCYPIIVTRTTGMSLPLSL